MAPQIEENMGGWLLLLLMGLDVAWLWRVHATRRGGDGVFLFDHVGWLTGRMLLSVRVVDKVHIVHAMIHCAGAGRHVLL